MLFDLVLFDLVLLDSDKARRLEPKENLGFCGGGGRCLC